MIATRSSTVNSGCFSTFTRMAIRTRSNTRRPRSTMSRWPFVIGSKEPGKTASDPSRGLVFISRLLRARLVRRRGAAVEAQAVIPDPKQSPSREGAYSHRKRALVEVLGDRDAALREQRVGGELEQREVEVARVRR